MSALITAAAAIIVIGAGLVLPPILTIPVGVISLIAGYPMLGGIFIVCGIALLAFNLMLEML